MYEEENLTGGLYVFSYKKSNERNSLIALTNKNADDFNNEIALQEMIS